MNLREGHISTDGSMDGVVIAGHFQEDDSYVTKRPAGREDWLILYTLGGQGYVRTSDGERFCSSGEVALIKPGTAHQYGTVAGGSWQFVWAHFSARDLEASLLPVDALTIQQLESGQVRKRVYRAFRHMISDLRERPDYWRELAMGSLRDILMLLAQRRNRKLDPRIEETLHYLTLHMRESVRIELLARTVGLSASRLSHMFKASTGASIIDTLNRMRIRQAALYLEHTDRTASEVAYEVGFHNYNHFILQFKKWYGESPSAYKKRLEGITGNQ
ncbi:helix-turn-helix domain-containing protein [Paenibacillus daejeonensis]|uniref:helix-turn-helix domain-containing protein n=1 Tax=Paenibacillus daejeonensis TaxID=135193 RepID=UPI00035C7421|nr:helix-turn-helix domain-containing protein [Paenibacillus daejeonensis]